jgi:hypothetical protein
MAKLWQRINDHERALENYEKALRSLGEKEKREIPDEDLPFILESERQRVRWLRLHLRTYIVDHALTHLECPETRSSPILIHAISAVERTT